MTAPRTFARYVALGDSISIDLYPALHHAGAASESVAADLRRELGAASLLYRNDDELWPEFSGRDLVSLVPGIEFRNAHDLSAPLRATATDNFATDGATTAHVLAYQLPRMASSDESTLVTLTAGGNDLLEYVGAADPPERLVVDIVARTRRIVDRVLEKRPNSMILLSTVYDPSDGTNDLGWGPLDREARWLAEYNANVRAMAARRVCLADLHRHFMSHGRTASGANFWYWPELIIEPGLRGASEVRRVWLEALAF
jgi:lysophospholipase L1-like esterase